MECILLNLFNQMDWILLIFVGLFKLYHVNSRVAKESKKTYSMQIIKVDQNLTGGSVCDLLKNAHIL
jgi:hypothetical protein